LIRSKEEEEEAQEGERACLVSNMHNVISRILMDRSLRWNGSEARRDLSSGMAEMGRPMQLPQGKRDSPA
jgi:hypothetical protein